MSPTVTSLNSAARLAEAIPPDRVAEVLPLLTEVREYLDRARD